MSLDIRLGGILPRCLFGSFLSRQGSSLPDGALILAVRELKSVSAILRDTSAELPTFSWDVLVIVSSPSDEIKGVLDECEPLKPNS